MQTDLELLLGGGVVRQSSLRANTMTQFVNAAVMVSIQTFSCSTKIVVFVNQQAAVR